MIFLPKTSPRKNLIEDLYHTILSIHLSFLEICHKFVEYLQPKIKTKVFNKHFFNSIHVNSIIYITGTKLF